MRFIRCRGRDGDRLGTYHSLLTTWRRYIHYHAEWRAFTNKLTKRREVVIVRYELKTVTPRDCAAAEDPLFCARAEQNEKRRAGVALLRKVWTD